MKISYQVNKNVYYQPLKQTVLFFLFAVMYGFPGLSQCPANLDFETGTFDGWTCWAGTVAVVDGQNVITLASLPAPLENHHTMLSSFPGDGLDEYGGFPKNCPNGSGHSIRLGNDEAGGLAEGISYEFVVPQNSNKFTLTYSYAVVFEDPQHLIEQQPRLEIEVMDMTEGRVIDCFSFSYVAYSLLPGFFTSPIRPHESPVRYKDWTTNTIYLNGYEGKSIRLFIKTADCTYAIHFGYAYIDVNSKCDNSLAGETFCAQDTTIDVTAPSGYQEYHWYNADYSQLISTQQVLHFTPPPPAGTKLSVELIPFPGYGCKDTIALELQDTLVAYANAGPDVASCNLSPVQLGFPPVNGMRYKWSPAYGLSDPDISDPMAFPDRDTTYVLTAQSIGGGCLSTDTVKVFVKHIDNSLQLIGDLVHCAGVGPDPVLKVSPVDHIQWYKNDLPIPGATQSTYQVTGSGIYHASLLSNICVVPILTNNMSVTVDTASAGISYPMVDVAFNFPFQLQARNFNNGVFWTPGTSLDDRTSFTPYFKSFTGQLYTIEIKDQLGCTTVDTQLVKTHKEIAIYVPSAFTPGGDGVNDYLRPLLLGFEKVKYFRIFDRWGKLLFEANTDYPGWDGRVKTMVQEPQTVVWMLEAVDIDGKTHYRKGTTLLMH